MRVLKTSICAAICAVTCFVSTSAARATLVVDLDFSVNSSLPSAQGMSYVGSTAESNAFSVSNSLLHLNTKQLPSDVYAYL